MKNLSLFLLLCLLFAACAKDEDKEPIPGNRYRNAHTDQLQSR